ncbi:DUF2279 domain-containing protein [Flavobacterium sp.]|uniref:DUF2279 domain-containing protein n=1 Tax=Flavobacterium sp. TaxID=239 RepID=UPI003D6BE25B
MKLFQYIVCVITVSSIPVFPQSGIESFLKPADSLHKQRRNAVVITEAIGVSGALVGLNELWYKDYPRSKFHFINDNDQWLQMDKMGHTYSAYHIGSAGASLLQWSWATKKQKLIYGSTLGFAFLTAVEVLDGYSQKWGASGGDVIANATGTGLYVSQELLWNEQRIIPKFSFHTTSYTEIRPELLGKSLNEQVLKDYNGQTYWLSANVHSFFKASKIPKWLNVAVGYGADGMVTGDNEFPMNPEIPVIKRYRQFYFSFDADLTKIETKSHVLKTFFSIFNLVKIPAPAIEIGVNRRIKGYFIYF